MRPNYDCVPADFGNDVTKINQLFDRMYLLTGRMACYGADEIFPLEVRDEIFSINDDFEDYAHLKLRVSGQGFMPAVVPDGETETIYTNVQAVSGTFERIDIADGEDFEYLDRMTFEDETDADDESDTLIKGDLDSFSNRLLAPPSGLRLYADFLLHTVEGPEDIYGSAVRAGYIETFAIMDVSTLTLDAVEPPSPYLEVLEDDEIEDALIAESRALQSFLKDTSFRRMSGDQQQAALESRLTQLNEAFELSRFQFMISPEDIYVPEVRDQNYRMRHFWTSPASGSFAVEPIYLDSLEHFRLSNGRRIYNNSRMIDPAAGLCIVAEVDVHTQAMLGLDTNVIWIPVRTPKPKHGPKFTADVMQRGIKL